MEYKIINRAITFGTNTILEETVIGFLNSKDGGNIYIGVDDNGNVIGIKTI